MGDLEDWEAGVVRDPHTPPQALADIAERRYDLHAAIAAHPRVYPGLIQWMDSVKPAAEPSALPEPFAPAQLDLPADPAQPAPSAQPAPPASLGQSAPAPYANAAPYANTGPSSQYYPISAGRPVPPPRRRGVGCWLAGCGCLTLAGLFMVVLFVLGGLGSLPSSGDGTSAGQSDSEETTENLAAYQADLEAIRTLSADLAGNPVAPLVLDQPKLDEIIAQATDPDITVFASRSVKQSISWFRANLETVVAAAQQRRTNASGTASEALVDQAGNGYIDIAWDADTACGDIAGAETVTVACPVGGSSPMLHIMTESYFPNQAALEHVVLHELAHLYQSADEARFADDIGDADRLIGQGLFNSSNESFADCYALTYQNLWSLSFGNDTYGYGYVCNDSERQAMRDWAASMNVPLP